jgi:hypothetical protein
MILAWRISNIHQKGLETNCALLDFIVDSIPLDIHDLTIARQQPRLLRSDHNDRNPKERI